MNIQTCPNLKRFGQSSSITRKCCADHSEPSKIPLVFSIPPLVITSALNEFKGLPGCFFTRTSFLKSSNNLEPICNIVNIKCSWLVIYGIMSVTSSFTVWGTHTTIYIFFLALTINCFDGLVVSVLDSYFGDRWFEPQPNRLLCRFFFLLMGSVCRIIWVYFKNSFLIIISNLKEICPGSCFPRNYLKICFWTRCNEIFGTVSNPYLDQIPQDTYCWDGIEDFLFNSNTRSKKDFKKRFFNVYCNLWYYQLVK